jgi:hypothetical protein
VLQAELGGQDRDRGGDALMTTDFDVLIPDLKVWREHNGHPISPEDWVANLGNFRMAIGYSRVFWPSFVQHDRYVLREGFSSESHAGFEQQCAGDRARIEAVMNHLHLDSIQHLGCEDINAKRLEYLGNVLKEIHEVKLKWQFPELSFVVEFHKGSEFSEYEISFWQRS